MGIFRAYLGLVPEAQQGEFFTVITGEFARSLTCVETITGRELLAGDPTLMRSIDLRNPYVDPISYLQAELLGRLRDLPQDEGGESEAVGLERGRLEEAVMVSLLGIATGLRSTG